MSSKAHFNVALVFGVSIAQVAVNPAVGQQAGVLTAATGKTAGHVQSDIDALTAQANDRLLATLRGQVESYLLGATELLRWREHLIGPKPLAPALGGTPRDRQTKCIEVEHLLTDDGHVATCKAVLPSEGMVQLELRYVAPHARKVRLFINGALVNKRLLSSAAPAPRWSVEGVYHLAAGSNNLQFESAGDEPLPKIEKILLIPTTVSLKPVAATTAPLKPPHVIARERGLIREVLENWTDYLAATDTGDHPVFAAWHELRVVPDDELACCAESVVRDYAGLGPDGTSLLTPLVEKGLIGFAPSSMLQVAQKYGRMFAEADRAWPAVERTPAGKNADGLPDSHLEPFRKVLYDPAGPFALPVHPEAFYPPPTRDRLNQLRAALAASPIKPADTSTRP